MAAEVSSVNSCRSRDKRGGRRDAPPYFGLSFFEPPHGGALEFAVRFLALKVFAFVEFGFAFADGQSHFDLSIFPIERERNQCIAFDRGVAEQFANFTLMQQELAGG